MRTLTRISTFVKQFSQKSTSSTEILNELKKWLMPSQLEDDNLDDLFQLSERSLIEVKHLTEYEDEKANRILTAVAFLSTLAGVLYIGLVPKDTTGSIVGAIQGRLAPILYHIVFGIYCLLTIVGAFLVIKAVRPKFYVPKGWSRGTSSTPPSFLFFEKILEVSPKDWAHAFNINKQELKIQYIKDFIQESYLVAEKIRAKLKYLQPGVRLLQIAVLVLAIWIPICAWNVMARPKTMRPHELNTSRQNTTEYKTSTKNISLKKLGVKETLPVSPASIR